MNRPTSDRLDISDEALARLTAEDEAAEREAEIAERRAAFRFLAFMAAWALIFGALCVAAAL